MLFFCLQCLYSSSLYYLWFLPRSFHCHYHLFYHRRCTSGYLISTMSHFWRLKLRFTLSVKFQIHNIETWVLKKKSPFIKCQTSCVEGQALVVNHQLSNIELQVPRIELWQPITNHQMLRAELWEPITTHQTSNVEGWDPRANYQLSAPRAELRCQSLRLLFYSEVRCILSGLGRTDCITCSAYHPFRGPSAKSQLSTATHHTLKVEVWNTVP